MMSFSIFRDYQERAFPFKLLKIILPRLLFIFAFTFIKAEDSTIFYQYPDTRISMPITVFFPNKDDNSLEANAVKIGKGDNLFYQIDSNVFICMDSSKSVEFEKFKTNDSGYYKIAPITNHLNDQSYGNKTSFGFFWVKDTVKKTEPLPWKYYEHYFWEGFHGWPARTWINRQWLRTSSNWHLRRKQWPWNANPGNYICLRGDIKGRCRDTLFSPNIFWYRGQDSLFLKFRVLFWPKKYNVKSKAQFVYSTDGGKTWPYVLKSYKNYTNGYDTFKIRADPSVPNPKIKLAWIYSGDLNDIVAWCIDEVSVITPIITAFDVAPKEICWPPEIITPNDSQSVCFIIENLGGLAPVRNVKAEAWIGTVHSETTISHLGWSEKSLIKLKVPVTKEGKYLIKVITSFNNNVDECPMNDTLTDSLVVIAFPPDAIEGEAEIYETESGVFIFYQNYPNPFSNTTIISYQLPQTIKLKLSIYDITGRIIRKLIDEEQTQGYYGIVWNGKGDNGKKVSSGIYFYRLETELVSLTKKIIFAK